MRRPLALLGLVLSAAAAASAGDAASGSSGRPHPHTGKVPPFKPGAPDLVLTAEDERLLDAGKTVTRQVVDLETNVANAFAVQDISAPTAVVTDRILDFGKYPKMVSGVNECGNYETRTHPNGTQTIKTRMVIGVAFVKFEYFIHHTYYPNLASITWTLDYKRFSELDESVGYWYIAEHPTRPHWSRVYYSVNVMLRGKWPEFIVDIMQRQALTQATSWVKLESEKEAKKLPPPPALPNPKNLKSKKRCMPWNRKCKKEQATQQATTEAATSSGSPRTCPPVTAGDDDGIPWPKVAAGSALVAAILGLFVGCTMSRSRTGLKHLQCSRSARKTDDLQRKVVILSSSSRTTDEVHQFVTGLNREPRKPVWETVVLAPSALASHVCQTLRRDVAVCVSDSVVPGSNAVFSATNLATSALREMGVEWVMIPPPALRPELEPMATGATSANSKPTGSRPSLSAVELDADSSRILEAFDSGLAVVKCLSPARTDISRATLEVKVMISLLLSEVKDALLKRKGRCLAFAIDFAVATASSSETGAQDIINTAHRQIRREVNAKFGPDISARVRLFQMIVDVPDVDPTKRQYCEDVNGVVSAPALLAADSLSGQQQGVPQNGSRTAALKKNGSKRG